MPIVRQHELQKILGGLRQLKGRGRILQPPPDQVRHPGLRLHRPRHQRALRQGWLASEHHKQDDADTPQVRLGPVGASPSLRRHVGGRALDFVPPPVQVVATAHPQVDHLEVAELLRCVHEVLRLHVEVAAILRVATLKTLEDVAQSHRCIQLGHPALLLVGHPVEQVRTLAQLEDEVQVALFVVILDQLDDMWMIQCKQRRQLVLVALGLAVQLAQPLHGPGEAQQPVLGDKNFAEAALADLTADLVGLIEGLAASEEHEEVTAVAAFSYQALLPLRGRRRRARWRRRGAASRRRQIH
mmetsp:Transcript_164753/g.528582  ORF Transcript_164753/g.528582 Transcript_164753/m.528582 type:complete len:299 (+) Transcript_164753:722-1618(+)